MKLIRFLVTILAVLSAPVYADLPLTIDDLITDKGKIKFDLSLSYFNSERQGISTGEPITIQTGATSFVTIPIVIGDSRNNSDFLVGSLGLHYGLTNKTEIYARTSYLYSSSRTSDISGKSSDSNSRFVDLWAGVNYQFKKDEETPALLGFAEIVLSEKLQNSSNSFKTALMGITTYKAIDPIVFSLTTAYRFSKSSKDGNNDYKSGNLLYLNPSIAFAVNERVTLTTGIQWSNLQAEKLNGKTIGFRRTSTDSLLGVGYGVSKESTINLTFKSNISGSKGADLRFNWLYTF